MTAAYVATQLSLELSFEHFLLAYCILQVQTLGKCGHKKSEVTEFEIHGFSPESVFRPDSTDMSMIQNKLYNQKLQVHEGRLRKIMLDKLIFDRIYIVVLKE